MRHRYLDVLKGILIIFVVIGHGAFMKFPELHRIIYWFHIPVFFILNGYLTDWNKKSIGEFCRGKFQAYAIPYIAFSTFFILISPNKLMNIVRMLLGGNYNITWYSYPFWFINTLFISVCLYKVLYNTFGEGGRFSVAIISWILVHLFTKFGFRLSMPWGIEYSMIAIPYIEIGAIIRRLCSVENLKLNRGKRTALSIIGLTIFFIADGLLELDYELNIQAYIVQNIALDIIVPLFFFFFLIEVSVIFSRWNIIELVLEKLGKASLVILFSHAAVMRISKELMPDMLEENQIALLSVVIALLIGSVLWCIFSKNYCMKKVFLGK